MRDSTFLGAGIEGLEYAFGGTGNMDFQERRNCYQGPANLQSNLGKKIWPATVGQNSYIIRHNTCMNDERLFFGGIIPGKEFLQNQGNRIPFVW